MGSHTVSTEHVISMYWNVCLMMVTVTETCSSFTLLNILLCFEWTTFWLVVQHDGLAPIKYLLRHVCLSVWPSSWNNSTTTGRIFTKFCYFSKIYPEYSSFKCGKNNGYFTRRPVYTNDKILRNSSLVWEMIQTKAVEKIQPHISRSETPPPPFHSPENRAVCKVWCKKNKVEPDMPQMTMYYGACALHAGYLKLQIHSEYVVLTAFPVQQWLYKRAPQLRLYINCVSCLSFTHRHE